MIWLVGAAWVVALMVYLLDAPVEIVWMVLFLGTGTGIIEWARRKVITGRLSWAPSAP